MAAGICRRLCCSAMTMPCEIRGTLFCSRECRQVIIIVGSGIYLILTGRQIHWHIRSSSRTAPTAGVRTFCCRRRAPNPTRRAIIPSRAKPEAEEDTLALRELTFPATTCSAVSGGARCSCMAGGYVMNGYWLTSSRRSGRSSSTFVTTRPSSGRTTTMSLRIRSKPEMWLGRTALGREHLLFYPVLFSAARETCSSGTKTPLRSVRRLLLRPCL